MALNSDVEKPAQHAIEISINTPSAAANMLQSLNCDKEEEVIPMLDWWPPSPSPFFLIYVSMVRAERLRASESNLSVWSISRIILH